MTQKDVNIRIHDPADTSELAITSDAARKFQEDMRAPGPPCLVPGTMPPPAQLMVQYQIDYAQRQLLIGFGVPIRALAMPEAMLEKFIADLQLNLDEIRTQKNLNGPPTAVRVDQ
jgi:hypothetical protein